MSVLVPLWAIHLHATAVEIGSAVAAVSVLPFFYAIPIGAIVDRLGSRTMLTIGSLVAAALYVLYPLFPSVWALVVLQMCVGTFQSVNWQAAQSYASKIGGDAKRAALMARFGSSTSLGTAAGPAMVGILAAFNFQLAFAGVTLWSLLLAVSTRLVEEDRTAAAKAFHFGLLKPRIGDFIEAASLLRSSAVVLVMMVTFLRLGMYSIRQSFYPVFLHTIAIPSDHIGFLIAAGALASSVSAAFVGSMTRYWKKSTIMLVGLGIGIVGQCITPLTPSYLMQMVFSIGSGIGIGVTLPLMLTVLADATPPSQRGLSVGLRNGMNRLATTVMPLGLGFIVASSGLDAGFFWSGCFLLAGVLFASIYQHKAGVSQQILQGETRSAGS